MKEKILVIEDDRQALNLMEYILRHEGYEVLSARDGLEGVKRARTETPDLIILDVMLPGLDGYEVCQLLREKAETSGLPILMISGKVHRDDREIGLGVGASDYLEKPVSPSTIVARVETLLADGNEVPAPGTGSGDV